MAGSKKGRDMADDPKELIPKINSHWAIPKTMSPNTTKRYKSQQAQDTKTSIRRGGARGA